MKCQQMVEVRKKQPDRIKTGAVIPEARGGDSSDDPTCMLLLQLHCFFLLATLSLYTGRLLISKNIGSENKEI